MSRIGDYDDVEPYPNAWALWEARVRRVMTGRPGQRALRELREALLALPEKRLIAGAFSTAGKTVEGEDEAERRWFAQERAHLLEREGEGVCAVGAFVWYQRVKQGEDPIEAMKALPLHPDYDGDGDDRTAREGVAAGLTYTLAWTLMQQNDDHFDRLTPEQRYEAFLRWLDEKIIEEPVDA